ncbi:Acyltransferase protein [Pseudomonas savastanoi pv. glycinea]|nr:Acyltransferase protein [Pseudomonas savastanoi pv. glycinea]
MDFRKDINGLRAIAVAAVLLFHFQPAWLPGGFAGVDVFFVISGYLITGIILRGLRSGKFRLTTFYTSRARRIVPALAVLCLALLLLGWFSLLPLDYSALGTHVASSLGFVSNVVYWREAGYFTASAHEKWLLHTWSLSVEWQFYLLYPIALLLLSRFVALHNLRWWVLGASLAGFVVCVCLVPMARSRVLPAADPCLGVTRGWRGLPVPAATQAPTAASSGTGRTGADRCRFLSAVRAGYVARVSGADAGAGDFRGDRGGPQ